MINAEYKNGSTAKAAINNPMKVIPKGTIFDLILKINRLRDQITRALKENIIVVFKPDVKIKLRPRIFIDGVI
jgi:hypothetical protein